MPIFIRHEPGGLMADLASQVGQQKSMDDVLGQVMSTAKYLDQEGRQDDRTTLQNQRYDYRRAQDRSNELSDRAEQNKRQDNIYQRQLTQQDASYARTRSDRSSDMAAEHDYRMQEIEARGDAAYDVAGLRGSTRPGTAKASAPPGLPMLPDDEQDAADDATFTSQMKDATNRMLLAHRAGDTGALAAAQRDQHVAAANLISVRNRRATRAAGGGTVLGGYSGLPPVPVGPGGGFSQPGPTGPAQQQQEVPASEDWAGLKDDVNMYGKAFSLPGMEDVANLYKGQADQRFKRLAPTTRPAQQQPMVRQAPAPGTPVTVQTAQGSVQAQFIAALPNGTYAVSVNGQTIVVPPGAVLPPQQGGMVQGGPGGAATTIHTQQEFDQLPVNTVYIDGDTGLRGRKR